MWFMGDIVGDMKEGRKINSKRKKHCIEAYYCLLPENAWFRFFQRSGAKICVKHQKSFWSVFDGWTKSDSWVILKKSQKIALGELQQSEKRILKPTRSS